MPQPFAKFLALDARSKFTFIKVYAMLGWAAAAADPWQGAATMTFFGLGTCAEDLKDQTRPVQYLGIPGLFQISLLYGRQRMIDNY